MNYLRQRPKNSKSICSGGIFSKNHSTYKHIFAYIKKNYNQQNEQSYD